MYRYAEILSAIREAEQKEVDEYHRVDGRPLHERLADNVSVLLWSESQTEGWKSALLRLRADIAEVRKMEGVA